MVNHLILSRNKDVRPPVKIAKVDTGKVPTKPGGGMVYAVVLGATSL